MEPPPPSGAPVHLRTRPARLYVALPADSHAVVIGSRLQTCHTPLSVQATAAEALMAAASSRVIKALTYGDALH